MDPEPKRSDVWEKTHSFEEVPTKPGKKSRSGGVEKVLGGLTAGARFRAAKSISADGTEAQISHRGHTYVLRGRGLTQRLMVFNMVSSGTFDSLVALVIVLNSAFIGIELSLDVSEQVEGNPPDIGARQLVGVAEHFFLVIYLVELVMRWVALGCQCFADHWVKFDAVLVFVGVVTNWILDPVFNGGDFANMTVFRIARLLKVARTLRILIKFKELWMLVRSLINSAGIIFYSIILLSIVLYIFGCMAVELVTKHQLNVGPHPDPRFQQIVDEHFSSLPSAMLTLLQFVCLDSIGTIYRPMIRMAPTLAFYFLLVVVMLGLVITNLITAVIVNGAMEQAHTDKAAMKMEEDEREAKLVREMRQLFMRLDKDDSGSITRDELAHLTEEDQTVMYGASMIGSPALIFDALDTDDSGCLGIDEFCDGIWEVAVAKGPIEWKRLDKQIRAMRAELDDVLTTTRDLDEHFKEATDAHSASGPLYRKAGISTYDESQLLLRLDRDKSLISTGDELAQLIGEPWAASPFDPDARKPSGEGDTARVERLWSEELQQTLRALAQEMLRTRRAVEQAISRGEGGKKHLFLPAERSTQGSTLCSSFQDALIPL